MPPPKDPEKRILWQMRLSESAKRRSITEEGKSHLVRIATGNKNRLGKFHSDASCKIMSESHIKLKRLGERSPSFGKHHSEESKRKNRVAHLGKPMSLESSRKSAESRIGLRREYNTRLKLTEIQVGGFWIGNVRYPDRLQYCELWKDVNPRVHAFFDYKCCGCGIPENGSSHIGHHVFYVKEACCWHSREGIYYSNLNAIDHKENDYCIGENPNYFVILCPSCHGKTNGKFANRKKWADYYRTMIDEQYEGKCFFTKEEMRKVTSSIA